MLVYVNGRTAQCFDPLLYRVCNPKVPEDHVPPPLALGLFLYLYINLDIIKTVIVLDVQIYWMNYFASELCYYLSSVFTGFWLKFISCAPASQG